MKNFIKRIMIAHNDNDFVRVWDWIGKVMLIQRNLCNEDIHYNEEKLIQMIYDLIPVGLKHVQGMEYNASTTSNIEHLSKFKYKINFSYDHDENYWMQDGGSDYLIIDFENNESEIY